MERYFVDFPGCAAAGVYAILFFDMAGFPGAG